MKTIIPGGRHLIKVMMLQVSDLLIRVPFQDGHCPVIGQAAAAFPGTFNKAML